jgi:hypothetical protein
MYKKLQVIIIIIIIIIIIDLVRKGIKSSIQVFERTEDFVDFTLYYNGYYDFIGKNMLLCPNNRICFF